MSIAHFMSFTTAPKKTKTKTKILNIAEKRLQGFFGKQ
jgi:hypothetical protein